AIDLEIGAQRLGSRGRRLARPQRVPERRAQLGPVPGRLEDMLLGAPRSRPEAVEQRVIEPPQGSAQHGREVRELAVEGEDLEHPARIAGDLELGKIAVDRKRLTPDGREDLLLGHGLPLLCRYTATSTACCRLSS